MKKRQAGWRIDAKWIAGILLVHVLVFSLFALSVWRLTSFEQAKALYTPLLNSMFQSVPEEGFQEIIRAGQAKPNQPLDAPMYPFRVNLKGKDVAGLNKDQLKTLLIKETIDALYSQGPGAIEDGGGKMFGNVAPFSPLFSIVTGGSHSFVRLVFLFSLVPVFLFGLLLILFSFRFGKLISPGICLVFVSLPVVVATTFFGGTKIKSLHVGRFISPAWQVYVFALLVGLLLIFAGLVAGLIFRLVARQP